MRATMDSKTAQRPDAKTELLEAARRVLLESGYAGLSTRAVAAEAGTQMSQIRYHFGSKEGLVLALFEHMNAALIERQSAVFRRTDLEVSEKWARSCDYLDEDLASGYVRVLQELIAVAWSNPAVGEAVRRAHALWHVLIAEVVAEVRARHGALGPFSDREVASLVSAVFIGAEALILLGLEEDGQPYTAALRRVGALIAEAEARDEET